MCCTTDVMQVLRYYYKDKKLIMAERAYLDTHSRVEKQSITDDEERYDVLTVLNSKSFAIPTISPCCVIL